MKKFSSILALLLALVIVGALVGCGDGGIPYVPPAPPAPPAPDEHIVYFPQFAGWGGLFGTNHSFNFDTARTNNCRMTYEFPTEADDYDTFEVTYILIRSTADETAAVMPNWAARSMKVSIKDSSKDAWTTDQTYVEYKESSTNAVMVFSGEITVNNQLTFEHNTNANGSTSFTILVANIRFYNE